MQVQKPEVKARMLTAAHAEFMSNGYERGNMRSIAESAGFTVGNLYRYFDDKNDLFLCVLNELALTDTHEMLLLELERTLNKEDRLLRHLSPLNNAELCRLIVACEVGLADGC